MKCKAKSKGTGKPCKFDALPGKTVCRYHGGLSLAGSESPSFKHGRYSAYLPAELMGKYTEAQKDPDLLNLRDEIALNDVLLKQLVEQINQGGGSKSWKEVQAAWEDLKEAQRNQDNDKTTEILRKLNDIITKGAQQAAVWNDIITTMDNRRKLTASEAKRLSDMQQMITAEKAMALVYALIDIVRRNIVDYRDKGKVADDKLLSAIAEGTRALVTLPARREDVEIE